MSKKYINGVLVKDRTDLGKRVINANKHFITNYEGITIHNNGNTRSSAEDDIVWASKKSTYDKRGYHPSWSYSVDKGQIVRYIPYGYSSYHAGDGVNGKGNAKTIGIEVNEYNGYNNPSDEYWERARANSIKLVAQLLIDHNWGIEVIKQHNYYSESNKNCPRVLRKGNEWNKYLLEIEQEVKRLKSIKEGQIEETKKQPINENIAKVNKEGTGSVTKDVNFNLESEKYNKLLEIVGTIKDNKYKAIGTIIVLLYVIFDIVKELF